MEDRKSKYRDLCKKNNEIPIFSRDWWLDTVCGEDNWNIALTEKGSSIVGTMPYYLRRKSGLNIISMPTLTQTMGPWLNRSNGKTAKELGDQKDIMNELIQQLPPYAYFNQIFHSSITNWLPFYWHGFKQSTKYTYVIEDLNDSKKIWDGFLPNIRTDIKKAQNRFKLVVRTDLSLDLFLDVNEKTFQRQGLVPPYSRDFVRRLDASCEQRNCRKIFFAWDENEKVHSAAYIIWDENSAYYLLGGGDPDLRNSGANSLCMWEAIKFAATVTKRFDFEGSMIESVERFFRAFGASQVPYFQITKVNSRILKFMKIIPELIK